MQRKTFTVFLAAHGMGCLAWAAILGVVFLTEPMLVGPLLAVGLIGLLLCLLWIPILIAGRVFGLRSLPALRRAAFLMTSSSLAWLEAAGAGTWLMGQIVASRKSDCEALVDQLPRTKAEASADFLEHRCVVVGKDGSVSLKFVSPWDFDSVYVFDQERKTWEVKNAQERASTKGLPSAEE